MCAAFCSTFRPQVKLWITINEPEMITVGYAGPSFMAFAPALYLDSPANYIVACNILKAHARVYRLYDKKFRSAQKGPCEIVFFVKLLTRVIDSIIISCFRQSCHLARYKLLHRED